MDILKRRLPERIIRKLGRHPMVVVSVASLGVRLGKDAMLMNKGEIDPLEFRRRFGSHLGNMGGGIAGAAAGAAAGSVLPGLGTILGAFAGGMVGENLGGRLGRKAVEQGEVLYARFNGGATPAAPPPSGEAPQGYQPPKRHL